jgi:hypothetical protein
VKVIDKVKYYWYRFLANAPGWKAAVVSTLNSLLGFGLGLAALAAGLNEIVVNGQPIVSLPADVIAGLTIGISLLRTLVAAINPLDPTFGLGSRPVDTDVETSIVIPVDGLEPVDLEDLDDVDAEEEGPELELVDAPDDATSENDVDLRLS